MQFFLKKSLPCLTSALALFRIASPSFMISGEIILSDSEHSVTAFNSGANRCNDCSTIDSVFWKFAFAILSAAFLPQSLKAIMAAVSSLQFFTKAACDRKCARTSEFVMELPRHIRVERAVVCRSLSACLSHPRVTIEMKQSLNSCRSTMFSSSFDVHITIITIYILQ